MHNRYQIITLLFIALSPLLFSCGFSGNDSVEILNVSYDPTREFFRDYNLFFESYWKKTKGESVSILQSHGGSGKQARSVIDGLEAHVVTLALSYDIDAIASKSGAIAPDWQQRLPYDSAPYTSTIVFLVRKGNPKNIIDWNDLIRPDIQVVTPNPKTSGGARWNYLAAFGYALITELGREKAGYSTEPTTSQSTATAKALKFVERLFRNVPILDSGARAATTTFARREIGDVLVTWENEAFLAIESMPEAGMEVVVPSISILTEPTVAWVDAVTLKRNTLALSRAYLEMLFSAEAQALAAKHHFRPREPQYAAPEDLSLFRPLELFSIKEIFGGWKQAHDDHFSEKGTFNRIYANISSR